MKRRRRRGLSALTPPPACSLPFTSASRALPPPPPPKSPKSCTDVTAVTFIQGRTRCDGDTCRLRALNLLRVTPRRRIFQTSTTPVICPPRASARHKAAWGGGSGLGVGGVLSESFDFTARSLINISASARLSWVLGTDAIHLRVSRVVTAVSPSAELINK